MEWNKAHLFAAYAPSRPTFLTLTSHAALVPSLPPFPPSYFVYNRSTESVQAGMSDITKRLEALEKGK